MHDSTARPIERAIAVAIRTGNTSREQCAEHLDELEFLAETAGAEVIEKITQDRAKPDGATYIGRGKVDELLEIIETENIQLVIFDDDLSPAQLKNLENRLKVKVLDRSGLILDIFAAHARTMEAKTQVELAQLEYMLPRLSRMWTHLSKQYGGIGMKGPGETQIETDRRLVRTRIAQLKRKLEKIQVQKEQQRKRRSDMPRFALVGYTNVGKSTLMNLLSEAGVYVQNKLFATLDTTVRTIRFESGRDALLSDTVGFIRKLPPNLVASFRSTLAEILEADFLLHVVDAAHPAFREHIAVVKQTLEELGVGKTPVIMVYNKVDLLDSLDEIFALHADDDRGNWIAISAERGIHIPALLERMQKLSEEQYKEVQLLIPYSAMQRVAQIYSVGEVLERRDLETGIAIRVRLENRYWEQLAGWQEEFAVAV